MVKVIMVVLAVFACPLLWTMVIVPLIANFFGVPIKIGALPVKKRDPRMSERQSFWFAGVLGWGVGFSLLGTLLARFIDNRQPTILQDLFGFVGVISFWGLVDQDDWTYPTDKDG
jgi:hypothetical protein